MHILKLSLSVHQQVSKSLNSFILKSIHACLRLKFDAENNKLNKRQKIQVWIVYCRHFVTLLSVRIFVFSTLGYYHIFYVFSRPNMVRWRNSVITKMLKIILITYTSLLFSMESGLGGKYNATLISYIYRLYFYIPGNVHVNPHRSACWAHWEIDFTQFWS